jgi:hypothetical protein
MSKFQQRHYEAVAGLLHEVWVDGPDSESGMKTMNAHDDAVRSTVRHFEQLFEADNPRFNREKFYKAVYRG